MKYKRIVEESIEEFIKFFLINPDYFLTESDLHAHLFKIIYEKLENKKLLKNKENLMTLHREYPTYTKYGKDSNKRLISGNTRGHFDLAVLDSESDKLYDENKKICIAIEFKMNEKPPLKRLKSLIYNDIKKLEDKKNRVEHSYFLFFIRNGKYEPERFRISGAKRILNDEKEQKTIEVIKTLIRTKKTYCYFVEYDLPWPDNLKEEFPLEKLEGGLYYYSKNKLQVFKEEKK